MIIQWMDGFVIRVSIDDGEAVISANREGLLSLAGQLTELAEETRKYYARAITLIQGDLIRSHHHDN